MTFIPTLCDKALAAIKNAHPSDNDREQVSTILTELAKDANKGIIALQYMQHANTTVSPRDIHKALEQFAKGEELSAEMLSPAVEYLLQMKKAAELAASGAVTVQPR